MDKSPYPELLPIIASLGPKYLLIITHFYDHKKCKGYFFRTTFSLVIIGTEEVPSSQIFKLEDQKSVF